jgi:hypothetical protein
MTLHLCCLAGDYKKEYGEGYFCIHPDSENNGFHYHWETISKNPEQAIAFEEHQSEYPLDWRFFWACFTSDSVIPVGCYRMPYPCELAINELNPHDN